MMRWARRRTGSGCKPRPGLLEAVVHVDFRLPSYPGSSPPRVQAHAPDLGLLRGRHLDRGLPARGLDQDAHDLADARLLPGAHVEGARAVAAEREHVGGGDVADEDEVAGLQAVAEDARLLPAQEARAGDRDHTRLAGAVLARAVHVAVPQRERGHAVPATHGVQVNL